VVRPRDSVGAASDWRDAAGASGDAAAVRGGSAAVKIRSTAIGGDAAVVGGDTAAILRRGGAACRRCRAGAERWNGASRRCEGGVPRRGDDTRRWSRGGPGSGLRISAKRRQLVAQLPRVYRSRRDCSGSTESMALNISRLLGAARSRARFDPADAKGLEPIGDAGSAARKTRDTQSETSAQVPCASGAATGRGGTSE
jgi:hypothetical protein